MPKPNLRQKPGNVYHTPTTTPAPQPRRFREVKGAIMPAESQENVDLWWGIFREIGEECPDRTRRPRRQRSSPDAER